MIKDLENLLPSHSLDELNSLIRFEEEIQNKEEIKAVRQIINEWGNNIPNHDLKNVGDQIEILSFKSRPIYELELTTGTDKRILLKKEKPYNNEGLPNTVIKADKINIWEEKILDLNEFEELDREVVYEDSREVKECIFCRGNGEIDCKKCKRSSKIRCDNCAGKGEIRCTSCGGKTEKRCSSCGGSGYKKNLNNELKNCWRCNGSGLEKCHSCHGGFNTCIYCNGKGDNDCKNCNGNGIIECSECKGKGKVLYYLVNQINIKNQITSSFLHLENLPIHINLKNRLPSLGSSNVFSLVNKQFEKQNFDLIKNEKFKIELSNLFNKERENLEESDLENQIKIEERILNQKINIYQFDCYQIFYRFNSQEYQLFIVGNEKQIFCEKSPFRDLSDSYFKNAEELFLKLNLINAKQLIDQAIGMTIYKDVDSIYKDLQDVATFIKKLKTSIDQKRISEELFNYKFVTDEIKILLKKLENSLIQYSEKRKYNDDDTEQETINKIFGNVALSLNFELLFRKIIPILINFYLIKYPEWTIISSEFENLILSSKSFSKRDIEKLTLKIDKYLEKYLILKKEIDYCIEYNNTRDLIDIQNNRAAVNLAYSFYVRNSESMTAQELWRNTEKKYKRKIRLWIIWIFISSIIFIIILRLLSNPKIESNEDKTILSGSNTTENNEKKLILRSNEEVAEFGTNSNSKLNLLRDKKGIVKIFGGEYEEKMYFINNNNGKISQKFSRDKYTEYEDYDINGYVRVRLDNDWIALMDTNFNIINTGERGIGFIDVEFPNAKIYQFAQVKKYGDFSYQTEYDILYFNLNNKKIVADREYIEGTDGEDLIAYRFKNENLIGFENYVRGEIVIKPKFNYVEGTFANGNCKVELNGIPMKIDKLGNPIK